MNVREMRRALVEADPVGGERREELRRLDFEAMEAELIADVDAGLAPLPAHEPDRRRRRVQRRLPLADTGRGKLALGFGAVIALVVALVIVLAGGGSERSSRAYGAELIRFAKSTPLLLLEGPDWRVQNVSEDKTREGTIGFMEFVTGKPVPLPNIRPTGVTKSGEMIVSGLQPPSVSQRLVQLRWRPTAEGSPISNPGGHVAKLPVLGTTAIVNTRAERFANQGGPGDREMIAWWTEGENVLELQASVPDLAGMEERLGWLTKVDSQAWLEAMPARVVKSADFEGTVKEMLEGVPLPRTFAISRVPDEGLTTSREQVEAKVSSTVACLWLRQWGQARRTGDESAALEAEKAMATSKTWPMFRGSSADLPYTAREIEDVAKAMRRGYWIYRGHPQDLLAHAESLGCARAGLPLLPEKMKRQRERGVPPPPD